MLAEAGGRRIGKLLGNNLLCVFSAGSKLPHAESLFRSTEDGWKEMPIGVDHSSCLLRIFQEPRARLAQLVTRKWPKQGVLSW